MDAAASSFIAKHPPLRPLVGRSCVQQDQEGSEALMRRENGYRETLDRLSRAPPRSSAASPQRQASARRIGTEWCAIVDGPQILWVRAVVFTSHKSRANS